MCTSPAAANSSRISGDSDRVSATSSAFASGASRPNASSTVRVAAPRQRASSAGRPAGRSSRTLPNARPRGPSRGRPRAVTGSPAAARPATTLAQPRTRQRPATMATSPDSPGARARRGSSVHSLREAISTAQR
jgi:hypothetical protein